jgi:HlyD family secretion protein
VTHGARATIEGWGGPPLEATVRRVESSGFTKISALGVEEQRVNILLDPAPDASGALQPGWARLGHGYRVDVRITVFAAEAVLKVPLSALFREGDSWAVFVDADGRAALRTITIEARDRTDAMVTDGLAAGERVVLYPSERVADGTALVERH